MIAARNANVGENKTKSALAFCHSAYNFVMKSPMKDGKTSRGDGKNAGTWWAEVCRGALTNYEIEHSRHQPLERPGNLGRAMRLSCSSKTIISSWQRYALPAIGRQYDDRRIRAFWLANAELDPHAPLVDIFGSLFDYYECDYIIQCRYRHVNRDCRNIFR